MPDLDDSVQEVLELFDGTETYDEAEFLLRDFSAKEISVNAANMAKALQEGVVPPGSVDAEDVAFTPTGSIAATDVQAAIAEVAAEAGGGGGWPVREFIVATTPPKAQTNFDNISASSSDIPGFGVLTSDNTNGASIQWDVALSAGTYALTVKGWPYDGGGILVFALDDGSGFDDIDDPPYSASSAALDTYQNPGGYHVMPQTVASDITISDDGYYTLRATVTGKNASSSGHATNLVWLLMERIA